MLISLSLSLTLRIALFLLNLEHCMKEIFDSWTHKTEHFQRIQRTTGIPYESMLFFDDEHRNFATVNHQVLLVYCNLFHYLKKMVYCNPFILSYHPIAEHVEQWMSMMMIWSMLNSLFNQTVFYKKKRECEVYLSFARLKNARCCSYCKIPVCCSGL